MGMIFRISMKLTVRSEGSPENIVLDVEVREFRLKYVKLGSGVLTSVHRGR